MMISRRDMFLSYWFLVAVATSLWLVLRSSCLHLLFYLPVPGGFTLGEAGEFEQRGRRKWRRKGRGGSRVGQREVVLAFWS
jgi:hypothetical protein